MVAQARLLPRRPRRAEGIEDADEQAAAAVGLLEQGVAEARHQAGMARRVRDVENWPPQKPWAWVTVRAGCLIVTSGLSNVPSSGLKATAPKCGS